IPGAISSWNTIDIIQGTSGCIDIAETFSDFQLMLIPRNINGRENLGTFKGGPMTFSLSAPGCADLENTTNINTLNFPGSEKPIYAITYPGSQLHATGLTVGEIHVTI